MAQYKMTPNEAHEYMENEIRCIQRSRICDRDCAKCELIKEDKPLIEAYGIAILSLEKQIPTKITHEATLYKCCTCPNCKNVVDEFIDFQGKKTRVTPSYCKYCGQALDWGED